MCSIWCDETGWSRPSPTIRYRMNRVEVVPWSMAPTSVGAMVAESD